MKRFLTALTLLICAVSVQAQEESPKVPPPPLPDSTIAGAPAKGLSSTPSPVAADNNKTPVFYRIILENDGAVAYDSTGHKWFYDISQDKFVDQAPDFAGIDELNQLDEPSVYLPPDVRCVDEKKGDQIDLFGDFEVGFDERIKGTVFASGNVVVKGLVENDVISLKRVTIENGAEVRGNVIAKSITKRRDGRIGGEDIEVPFPDIFSTSVTFFGGILTGSKSIFLTLLMAFLTVIVIALLPKQLNLVTDKIEKNIFACFGWGMLGWLLIGPVIGLGVSILALTVVGIPLIPFFVMAVILSLALAAVSSAIFIGRKLCPVFGWKDKPLYLIGLCGIIAFELLRWLWVFFSGIGLSGLGVLFLVLFIVVDSIALTIGFGAGLSTRFGFKRKKAVPQYDQRRPYEPPSKPPPPVSPPPPPSSSPFAPPPVEPPDLPQRPDYDKSEK